MNDDNVFGDGDDETIRVQIFPTLIGSSDDDDEDADEVESMQVDQVEKSELVTGGRESLPGRNSNWVFLLIWWWGSFMIDGSDDDDDGCGCDDDHY